MLTFIWFTYHVIHQSVPTKQSAPHKKLLMSTRRMGAPLLPNKVRKLFPWKPFLNRNWPLNTMNNISLHSHSECWTKYLLTRGTKHVGGASLRLTTLSQWQVTARRVTLPHSDMFIFIISQQLGTCWWVVPPRCFDGTITVVWGRWLSIVP